MAPRSFWGDNVDQSYTGSNKRAPAPPAVSGVCPGAAAPGHPPLPPGGSNVLPDSLSCSACRMRRRRQLGVSGV
eukprot:3296127-Alexandrium_andersonii.AAC.1